MSACDLLPGSTPRTVVPMTAPLPMILDVDTGVDDALALLLALRCPEVEVLAVTCVHGNGDIKSVLDNTLRVLDAAEARTELPVAAGFAEPLVEPRHLCPEIHGEDFLGDLRPPLPPSGRSPSSQHAVDVMLSTLRAASSPVTVMCLAPLTNIAIAFRKNPELWREKVERIVWMGGSVTAGGNASSWSEANAAYDPEAAHIVLTSGVPLLLYPLDAYLKVHFTAAELEALGVSNVDAQMPADMDGSDGVRVSASNRIPLVRSQWSSLAGRLLYREMRHFKMSTAGLGDAGAVAAALLPGALKLRRVHVAVEMQGARTRGMTVCDLRSFVSPPDEPQMPANADVVVDVDAAAIKALFARCVLASNEDATVVAAVEQPSAKRQRQ
eukprot:TRINITY_DN51054_c0_g1_i1.p1 TRINITY_DN51054_c0_g1~~TRINITY_DN51054_c0_g1_i1.p1  ORF type:complete len:390 (+),score=70.85 TRINITY_DN51054_c0_g1_i1:24-1172(+)